MPSLPSFYVSDQERKRQRSEELRAGLSDASKQATGSLDMLVKLQRLMAEDAMAKESKKHGRDIEERNQKRADAKAALDDEGSRLDNEKKRRDLDASSPAAAAETRGGKMRDAFDMVRASLGEDADDPQSQPDEANKGLSMEAVDAFDRLRGIIDKPLTQSIDPDYDTDYKRERARLEKARADAAEKKLKGGGGPPSVKSQIEAEKLKALKKKNEAPAAGDAPSEKALASMQDAEKKLANLDAIIAEKSKFNTGPLADRAADIAGVVLPEAVYDPSDRNAWKARVQEGLNEIIKEQAGSAASASEVTRQLIAQLNTTMDDSTFEKIAAKARASFAKDLENAKARLTPSSRSAAVAPAGNVEARRDQAPAAAVPSFAEFMGGG